MLNYECKTCGALNPKGSQCKECNNLPSKSQKRQKGDIQSPFFIWCWMIPLIQLGEDT